MKASASRIRILCLVIFAVALLFTVKLFFIQVIQASYYTDMADRQYLRSGTSVFDRGSIFAEKRDKTVFSLAGLKTAYIVAISPKQLVSTGAKLEEVYQKLNQILPVDQITFMKSANKVDDPYEEIATKVDQTIADKIKQLNIKGLNLYKQKLRSYPLGATASHVVGLLGYKGDDLAGRYGLERFYDQILSRQEGATFANFFVELFSGLGKSLTNADDGGEGDITTTIEPVTQQLLEKELAAAKDKWQSDSAGGVIIDPKTGEILAMTALPNYDPGQKQTDLNVLSNPLVEKVYEMGSIVKALTMASGLDAGVVNEKTTYNDKGCLTLNKKEICNYDLKARGVISMQEVLNQSLNLGATFVEQQLGPQLFRNYLLSFGLGTTTGIDLPSEGNGLVKNLKKNPPVEVDLANISFGQGIAITPIETVRALCVLGNGGYLIQPHLVKRIDYKNKLSRTIEPVIGPQVIKKDTSERITRMLVTVVDQKLANGKAKMEHYSIAAKTGTAQISNPATGKYYPDRYLHSFFGYFPAYEPRFLVFMFMVYPKEVQYSSETLTEPFINISRSLLNYYQVPPDR
jgi:cell division protein FtsI/penicillin-binding protein 2